MLRLSTILGSLILLCGLAASVRADSTDDDSLKRGDAIGVFYVTKIAGAVDDGVEPGEDLCYRCRYGSSPMVIIFSRTTSGPVVKLASTLDAAVAAHTDARLKGLLTLIGEDVAELKRDADKVAQKASVRRIPVVVAKEAKTGPLNYRLSPDVAVTVVVAKDSQVVSIHTFAADKVNVSAVMADVTQMLR